MQADIQNYLLTLKCIGKAGNEHQDIHDEVEYRWNLRHNEEAFLAVLQFYTGTNLRRTHAETKDIIYKDDHVRHQLDQNTDEEIWVHKQQVIRMFDYSKNAFMCHSRETRLPADISHSRQARTRGDASKLVRYKNRWSFFDVSVRIDITRVNTRLDKACQFEIEVEWDPNVVDKFWTKRLDYAISSVHGQLAKNAQLSAMTMNNHVRQNLQKDLLTYLNATDKHFSGTLPKTLLKSDLAKVLREANNYPYAISLKYDGERCLLFVQKGSKQVVAFSRKMVVIGIIELCSESKQSALLDCEFMMPRTYIIFDIVKYGLLDMRVNDANLLGRMKLATSICDTTEWPSDYTIMTKMYYTKESGYNSVFTAYSHTTYDGLVLRTDGLIITPILANYSQKSRTDDVFKWKPTNKQTVDCRASVTASGQCLLYILDKYQAEIEVFGGTKKVINAITNDDMQLDSKIVECVYDRTDDVMKILQIRLDKAKPNYITTTEDVWLAIHENITLDDLRSAFCPDSTVLTQSFWKPTECLSQFLARLSIVLSKRGITLALNASDINTQDVKKMAILRHAPDMLNVRLIEGEDGIFVLRLLVADIELPYVCVQKHSMLCEQAGLMVKYSSITDIFSIDEAHSIHENDHLLQIVYEQFIIVCQERPDTVVQKPLSWLDHLELASGKMRTPAVFKNGDFQSVANHFSIALHVNYHKDKFVKEYQPEITQHDLVHERQVIYLPLVYISIDETGEIDVEHECTEACPRSGCIYRSLKAYSNSHLAEKSNHLLGMFSQITLND